MMVGDLVGRRARLSPDRLALVDAASGERISYAAWAERIERTAALLAALGVGRGDRVAVLSHNSVVYLDLWMACGRIGAVLQTLSWRLALPELAALVARGEPRVLCYGDGFAQHAARLAACPSIVAVVALETPPGPGETSLSRRERVAPIGPVEVGWDDPWVICYTGGTTGLPKGALLTHRSMLWNAFNTNASWGLDADDVAALNAPLFHTGGINVFTLPLVVAGGASVVCRSFDAGQTLDLISTRAITLTFGVPTMFAMLQEHPRFAEVAFSRLKLVISGGAPCPMPIFERFFERGVDFKTGYGLTEAGPNTFWLPGRQARSKPGSVGYPLLFVEVLLVGAGGRACENGEPGELLVRGPHVCAGYFRDPEATRAAIHPTPADPSGADWLHTGDVAVRDRDGAYRIVDRVKEMFISGGENVYPSEVEAVLHAHPAVGEAAVVGVADARWGEVGRAFVVPRARGVSEPELLDFCRERLGRFKVPRAIVLLEALPRTGAGKIDKRALRSREAP